MKKPGTFLRQPIVIFLGSLMVLIGAGMAGARTQGGPPWAQDIDECETTTTDTTDTDAEVSDECEVEEVEEVEEVDENAAEDVGEGDLAIEDSEPVQADVEEFFATFDNDCGAAFLGDYDLGDADTLVAIDDLVTRLDAGQTSHGVQSVRMLLRNCEDHANDGLMNALYHHGLNWVKHYEHEQWLQEKFADKWPDGKPGNSDHRHGNSEKVKAEKTHGNPHASSSSSSSHGNGNGHSE